MCVGWRQWIYPASLSSPEVVIVNRHPDYSPGGPLSKADDPRSTLPRIGSSDEKNVDHRCHSLEPAKVRLDGWIRPLNSASVDEVRTRK